MGEDNGGQAWTPRPDVVNLAFFLPRSAVNGPGERAVVWVQGCPLGCPGCWNPDTHPATARELVPVADLAARILSISGIEGVTYSGGEPFQQAAALARLSHLVRAAGLSTFCFSGYTMEEIRASGDVDRLALLAVLDVLVDGRYDRQQPVRRLWRGSANQRVHFLTDRYAPRTDGGDEPGAGWELVVGPQGTVTVTGFPNPGATAALGRRLASQYGVHIRRDPPAGPARTDDPPVVGRPSAPADQHEAPDDHEQDACHGADLAHGQPRPQAGAQGGGQGTAQDEARRRAQEHRQGRGAGRRQRQ